MPPIVCGRTIESVVRQRGTPSARLASRSELGTSASTSIVERATSGSIRHASANAPAKPLWPCPTTTRPKTKMPITIAGTPFSTSSARPTRRADRRRRELVQVDRDEDPDRQRHQRREPDEHERADERVREPLRHRRRTRTAPGVFVIRSRLSAPAPRFATDQTTMHEDRRPRSAAASHRERFHQPVDARAGAADRRRAAPPA